MRDMIHSSTTMNFSFERTAGRRHDAGQDLTIVTIGAVFLCGVLGCVVEVGHGYYLKQITQAAAASADGRHAPALERHAGFVPDWAGLQAKSDGSTIH